MQTRNTSLLYRVHRAPVAHLLAAHLACVEEHQREMATIRALFAQMDVLLSGSSNPVEKVDLGDRPDRAKRGLGALQESLRTFDKLFPLLFGSDTHPMCSWEPPKHLVPYHWDRRKPLPVALRKTDEPPPDLALEAGQMESLARACRRWSEDLIRCSFRMVAIPEILAAPDLRKVLLAKIYPSERYAEKAQYLVHHVSQGFRDDFWLPEAFGLPWALPTQR